MIKHVTDSIYYVGVDDKDIDLFENQYVVPNGMAYNSYVIDDEKIVIMDMVDVKCAEEWYANLDEVLKGRQPDYLVMSHLEPDHSANLTEVLKRYPELKVVSNAKLLAMIPNFFPDIDLTGRTITVDGSEPFDTGVHKLNFVMAPMVHWPEVMVTYESAEKVLFAADAFGKFGTLDTDEDWACEARRYYFNIVGKYGMPVQALLKKAENLDIQIICSLHGPILKEDLGYYINLYKTWSSYEPEDKGVFIAYSTLHGNTGNAAKKLAELLKEKGCPKVVVSDLAREDMAECVEDAFRYDRMVLASPTYDGGLMPVMMDFIYHLKSKAYQNRTVGFIENGSWAPMSGKLMKEQMAAMKNINIIEDVVTVKSALKAADEAKLEELADKLMD
ncbi:FprA family A-type flavoprotein [Coprococcus sp. OM04-5BH]|uniref:FprA family A-type flavoprotein n=1 Tax=Coprococcus sp. OM04-5BH TaxID=2293093 RepID=UPI000E54242F|nr:FprA family A-type flavoprotein [Coprococcus sp. OM04-5BH]RHV30801.1 FprA family A-type flavoprotein [Coprococcus sp. OM04-5BH]